VPESVVTRAFDNARGGTQYDEDTLTPAEVRRRGISRLFRLSLHGDARGMEAQPLISAGTPKPGGGTRDLLLCATMANNVHAFDAASLGGPPAWVTNLGTPVKGSKAIDNYEINDNWGILSTPVIDDARKRLYCVAWVSPDRSVAKGDHLAFAIDLKDGSQVGEPILLDSATYKPGDGLPTQRFVSVARKQRAALLLTTVKGRKTLFVPAGSVVENAGTNRGWLIAIDVEDWKIAAAWTSTVRGSGGGIWQAGAGPAADDEGFIYLMTGNGSFAPPHELSESIVKLSYTPAAGGAAARIEPVDWFTPFTDAERTGHLDDDDAHASADHHAVPMPTNHRPHDHNDVDEMWGDMDLSSGGPILIQTSKTVIGAGKDGIAYSLKSDAMGKTSLADLGHGNDNYKACRWIGFFTHFPGFQVKPDPANIRDLNVLFGGKMRHQHSSPLTWNSPDFGQVVANWGENGNLRLWRVDDQGRLHYLACSEEVSSPDSGGMGGMPGGFMCASLKRGVKNTTVIWASVPYKNANTEVTGGRFIAYDGSTLGQFPDGSGRLLKLWDSQDWNQQYLFSKFNLPIVWGGRVFLPAYDGSLLVFG
jgi:hypothetical protein